MIVISGALVLVSIVLLAIGIIGPGIGFVYASIATSVVAGLVLGIGILQRRSATSEPAAPTATEEPAAVLAAPAAPAGVSMAKADAPAETTPPVEVDDVDARTLDGTVLVVVGRPRYHAEGCRYLTGKQVEEVDVLAALDDGFTPCGVCKPDASLARQAAPTAAPLLEDDAPEAEADETELFQAPEPAPAPRVATTRARRAPAAPAVAAAPAKVKAPATRAADAAKAPATRAAGAAKAPATRAAGPAKAPATRAAGPAKAAPAKASAKSALSAPATRAAGPAKAAPVAPLPVVTPPAKAPAKATSRAKADVVVIPDRARFHQADCRYVRGVAEGRVITRAQATQQGYEACGVCRP